MALAKASLGGMNKQIVDALYAARTTAQETLDLANAKGFQAVREQLEVGALQAGFNQGLAEGWARELGSDLKISDTALRNARHGAKELDLFIDRLTRGDGIYSERSLRLPLEEAAGRLRNAHERAAQDIVRPPGPRAYSKYSTYSTPSGSAASPPTWDGSVVNGRIGEHHLDPISDGPQRAHYDADTGDPWFDGATDRHTGEAVGDLF